MSRVCPTIVEFGGSLVVLGLGPIGDMACRVARHLGIGNVIGIDLVPERLGRARRRGIDVADLREFDDEAKVVEAIRDRTARCVVRRISNFLRGGCRFIRGAAS